MGRLGSDRSLHARDILLCAILILSPFANLSLQGGGLGILGSSASFPFVIILVVLASIVSLAKGVVSKFVFFAVFWMAFLSMSYSLVLDGEINSESSYLKGVKYSILYLLTVSLALFSFNNMILLRRSAWIALVICSLSLAPPLADLAFLNYAGSSESRPRGLTMEASHFALIVGAITFIIFYLEKSGARRIFVGLAGLFLIGYSQSKAGVLLYCGSFVIYYLLSFFKRLSVVGLFSFLTSLTFLFLIVFPFFWERIENDMDRYTSTATRVTGLVAAFQVALKHPLGVGFAGYSEFYIKEIPGAISTVGRYLPGLNFDEVLGYTQQDGTKSLGAKSYFSDSLILFGIPFFLFYIYIFFKLFKGLYLLDKQRLLPGMFFAFFALTFWSSGVGFYAIFLLIGLGFSVLSRPSVD